ncbi:MAG TPA: ferritin-like domain-containing protein [Opitutaceae bacterium]|jgi:ferritin-like metal-binding protein YciE
MPAISSLKDLLIDELKDLYSAEQQLLKALPKMADAATNSELKEGFTSHLEQTKGHVQRLEEAFGKLDTSAKPKTCKAMQGLIAEGEEAIKLDAEDPIRDACLIGAAQRVEHYEIAAYGTARAFANTIGEDDVAELLQETLEEEAETNQKLTTMSATVNEDANSLTEREEAREPKKPEGRSRR